MVYHPVTRHRRLYSGVVGVPGSGSTAVQEHTYEYVRQWQVLHREYSVWAGGTPSHQIDLPGAGVTLDTI